MVAGRTYPLGLALAVGTVGLALLLRAAIAPWLGEYAPFVFLFPAVLVTAWFAGRFAGYAAIVVGAAATYAAFSWTMWPSFAVFVSVALALTELAMAIRRAEVRAQRTAERLDLALATGNMGVWEWNLGTDEVWWSATLEHLHGLATGAFGRSRDAFRQLVHADDRVRFDNALVQAAATTSDFSLEYRFVGASDAVRWMSSSGHVVVEGGQARRVVGTSRDVTEHHEAEGALREVETRFEAVMTHAPMIVFAKDGRGRYLMVNGAWAQFVGKTEPEILGWTDGELFPPLFAETISRFDRDVLATGEPRQFEESVEYREHKHTLQIIKFALRDTDGETPVAVCCIVNDITAHKQAEAALKEADRRKDEFLAILAHELRNPLAPIRLALEMLKTSSGDKGVSERAMDVMGRQLTHLVRLIDDLLDVSRITRGKLELRRGRVTLGDVVRTALETSRPQIDQAGHEIEVTLPDAPIALHADLTRLSQVISNLLNNAAKYTPRGGKISLRAELRRGEVAIAISDNGIGIAPEHVGHVFQMFAQVGPLTTRGHGGLGIGLALARALVDMHGGRLDAESGGPGKGSTFTVHLPTAPEDVMSTSAPDAPPCATNRLRVLVADDNRDAIDTLALFLERSGHTVRTANDGLEAIEVASAFHPDVAVLDIGMPRMDGYEVARQLRASGDELVLIALTGWGQADDHRRSREAGFDYHLIKPVQPSTLVKLLATASRAA